MQLEMISPIENPATISDSFRSSHISDVDEQKMQDKELRGKCIEFESMLFDCMLRTMRSTIKKSELFHGGQAEDIYTAMLDQEYAKAMAGNINGSLADTLYAQLVKNHISEIDTDNEK